MNTAVGLLVPLVCVECGAAVDSVIKEYSPGNIKLSRCPTWCVSERASLFAGTHQFSCLEQRRDCRQVHGV